MYLLFLQDDIVLIARTADGLRELLRVVQYHTSDLKMELSTSKSKVMSKSMDAWEIFGNDDDVVDCLEKVLRFKYLGVESSLSPFQGAIAMKKRALAAARRYKSACMTVARDGPDVVDVAMSTWLSIGLPCITFGCESVPFSSTTINEINRCQVVVGRDALGLSRCAPSLGVQQILGLRSFKEVLYTAQLKYVVRLQSQPGERWSRDAYLDHIYGTWRSPFLENLEKIKREVGMIRGPVSNKHVDIVVQGHFRRELSNGISELGLPALREVSTRRRARHINETEEIGGVN